MTEAALAAAGLTLPGSMERCVEEFLRSVRHGETALNTTETRSTERDLSNLDTASHSAVQKTAMKNKSGMKRRFHCDICKVAVYDAETLQIHLNGKKHLRKQNSLLKIRVGKEYIQRYENPGGILSAICELCCENISSDSIHLNSYSHILAYLKANHPKVFENLQVKGLNTINKAELKRIVVAEMFPEAFKQCAKLDNPAAVENLFPDQKSGFAEDTEPPPKTETINDPSCIDKPDTILEHLKEKNSDLVQNEKKDNALDQRLIQPVCQEYQECQTRNDLEHNRSKSPFNITCNEDLYTFLQYFQISDESDVLFIQQIVKKLKGELKEFNENDQQMTTVSDLNDGKDQEGSISKLKISSRAESIVQHADSTTTSNANGCTTNKSADDTKDHCKGEVTRNNAGNSERSSDVGGKRLEDVSTVAHLPENNSSKVTTAQVADSNSVSSHHSSDVLCAITKKPIIRPSVAMPILKSHGQSIASIKTEPDIDASVEEPQLDCTSTTNTEETATANNSGSSHHSSETCVTTNKGIIRPSVFTPVLKLHDQSIVYIKKEPDVDASVEPQLDSTTATNTKKPVVTGTTRSHLPVFDSSGTLRTGKPKCIIRPSVLSSVLKRSLPLESHVSIKKETNNFASDENKSSPEGFIGSTKAQSHSFKSEFSKDEPPSTYLESSSSDNNTVAPAAKQPRIDHLNLPTSPSNTHDADCISFGGKKNMQVSELIAEVAKFADTKPVLKGIDINQVVQILLQNRTEKIRNESRDSTT